ncbi:MAG: hypothetical protein NT166_17590 [Candidatus Aminicenantes bacterium]|nr:hypothetical protein [Candidatus Aminicenantes bacterium]
MSNRENLDKILDIISAIDDNRIKTPKHVPVSACVLEASTLYHWALKDKEALIAHGLAWELVEDLQVRQEAVAEAEALWNTQWVGRKELASEWESLSALAYELRDRLLADFRFAFRNQPDLQPMLKRISTKKNHPTMIQDLNDLSVLGRANRPLLEAVRFDMSLLEKAAQTSWDLTALLARTTTARLKVGEGKRIRDLAYTYLKEAVDEIRRTGQYVFRHDKERLSGYISYHLRQANMRQARKSKMAKQEQEEKSPKAV